MQDVPKIIQVSILSLNLANFMAEFLVQKKFIK